MHTSAFGSRQWSLGNDKRVAGNKGGKDALKMKDNDGRYPIDLAKNYNYKEVVSYLENIES